MLLSKKKKKPMAELIRNFVDQGIEDLEKSEGSGWATLELLLNNPCTGGPTDLSRNLDKYLYGEE